MPKLNLYYPNEAYLNRWREAADEEQRSLAGFVRRVVDNYLSEKATSSTTPQSFPQVAETPADTLSTHTPEQ